MIRQFIQRLFHCFYPTKIHSLNSVAKEPIYTPQRRPSEIFSPDSSSRVYKYDLFEIILERKLQELTKNK